MKNVFKNKIIFVLFIFFIFSALTSGIYLFCASNEKESAMKNILDINKNISAEPAVGAKKADESRIAGTKNNNSNPPLPAEKSIESKAAYGSKDSAASRISADGLKNDNAKEKEAVMDAYAPPIATSAPIESEIAIGQIYALYVGEKKYEARLKDDGTVLDLMEELKRNKELDFDGHGNAGLGFFVEEINGIKNDQRKGLYWIYYINNKSASVGASNYHLKTNDIITWKYEKANY